MDGNNSICAACPDATYSNLGDANCTNCTANCLSCNSSTCMQCAANYTLDPVSGVCYTCNISYCESCSSNDVCGTCNSGFNSTINPTTNASECSCSAPFAITGSVCACPNGTFSSGGTCLEQCGVVQYCRLCFSGKKSCLKCYSGFILSGMFSCVPQCPIANCTSCN